MNLRLTFLVDAYWDFLREISHYFNWDVHDNAQILKVKKEAMNDLANLLLNLSVGKKVSIQKDITVRILKALDSGCQTQKEIAEEIDVSEKTIKNHFPELKAQGFIKTKKHVGTELTEKGKKIIGT